MSYVFASPLFDVYYSDIIYIIAVIILLIMFIYILRLLKSREDEMKKEQRAKLDMLELEAITKNIEKDYKPINIELTSYEQEQENNAIISYDELVSNKSANQIKYDDSYQSDLDISVKKVNINENVKSSKAVNTKIDLPLMSYEKEEAFLKALRQLQSDLAR